MDDMIENDLWLFIILPFNLQYLQVPMLRLLKVTVGPSWTPRADKCLRTYQPSLANEKSIPIGKLQN